MPALRPREMTLEEWFDLPEDTPGELVDSVLVTEEMPGYLHEFLVIQLAVILNGWVFPRGGFVGGSDAKFAVGPRRGRKPDLTVYFPGRRPPAFGVVREPPDIAVEIVSPLPRDGRRDRVDKMDEYAAFGVCYYWIVDPSLRSIEIYELGADRRYARALGLAEGKCERVPGCDGLVLDADALWAALDRLAPETAAAHADPGDESDTDDDLDDA